MRETNLPWLSLALSDKGGALVAPAQAFLVEHLRDAAEDFRGGPPGLVFLCEQTLDFLALPEANEEDDRKFVEGGGALLGLLLIEHIGDACHKQSGSTHRVRLGPYGFFDPFSALDRVLDAQSPKAELMHQVSLAEAEARGEGPTSRVVCEFMAQLRDGRPELMLVDHFDLTLTLQDTSTGEPLEVDLKRAVDSTRDQDVRAVHSVTTRLMSMLPGSQPSYVLVAEARERLMPRIVRTDALHDLSASGKNLLASEALTSELSVALLLEYDGRARYVREAELSVWALTWKQAFEMAWRNLAARSKAARIAPVETPEGSLYVARTGDGRDSARIVLPAFGYELCKRLGPRVAVAVPHRDTFLACDADNLPLVAALRKRATEDAARAPHRLSDQVYLVNLEGVLTPLD